MYCFAKFCRLCLQRSDSLFDFKTKDRDKVSIINKIKTVMPNLILINENFPKLICDLCLYQINNSYNFINNCLATNQHLLKYNLQLNFHLEKSINQLVVLCEKLNKSKFDICDLEKNSNPVNEAGTLDGKYVVKVNKENGYSVTINVDPNFDGTENQKKNYPEDENRVYIVNISNNLTENNETGEKTAAEGEKHPEIKQELPQTSMVQLEESRTELDQGQIATTGGETSKKRRHACATCGKLFVSKPNLRRHYKNIHLKIKHNCQICGKKFTQIDSLQYHERVVHLNLRKYKCALCKKCFVAPLHLEVHRTWCLTQNRTHITSNDGSDDEGALVIDETVSVTDGTVTMTATKANVTSTENNVKTYRKSRKNFCKICRTFFGSFKEYRGHVRAAHPELARKFKCHLCAAKFVTKPLLEEHQHQVHEREGCTMCPKYLPNIDLLRLHYKHEHNVDEGRILQLIQGDAPQFEQVIVDQIEIKKEEIIVEDN